MKMMLVYMILFQTLAGCANHYVLHTRKDEYIWWKNSNMIYEKSEIVARLGLVLTPNRTPVVRIDPQLPDGSAWVYYRFNLKNTNAKSMSVDLTKLHIAFDGQISSAVFDKEEKTSQKFKLDANTSYQIPVKFYLKKEMIEKNKGNEPVRLSLPIENNEMISMELWLWHV